MNTALICYKCGRTINTKQLVLLLEKDENKQKKAAELNLTQECCKIVALTTVPDENTIENIKNIMLIQ